MCIWGQKVGEKADESTNKRTPYLSSRITLLLKQYRLRRYLLTEEKREKDYLATGTRTNVVTTISYRNHYYYKKPIESEINFLKINPAKNT